MLTDDSEILPEIFPEIFPKFARSIISQITENY